MISKIILYNNEGHFKNGEAVFIRSVVYTRAFFHSHLMMLYKGPFAGHEHPC